MHQKDRSIRLLCVNAMIAALYACLTILLAPISYGVIQLRLSEALCVLPLFMPQSTWGLFIGCLIANIFSGNIFDIIFGSLATLFSVLSIAALGKRGSGKRLVFLSCLIPVFFNSLIVGAVITFAYEGQPLLFFANCLYVGLGELGVMLLFAFPLALFLKRGNFFDKF